MNDERILHLVSDSTGETAGKVIRACLVQFEHAVVREYSWSFVRTKAQLDDVIKEIQKNPGFVLFTLVEEELRQTMFQFCRENALPHVSMLDPILLVLENYLGVPMRAQPGRQHRLDADYFRRIEAVDFAVNHDDGQGTQDLARADVVLVGCSRMSKTPTCIYLAYRGIKAANIPFVPEIPLPDILLECSRLGKPLIVGLTQDAGHLINIRRSRLSGLGANMVADYVEPEQVKAELLAARRLFTANNWPVIDVTRRSIEETAAMIMQLLHKEQG